MPATIKDVALLVGVSIGTVSNVLNNKPVRADLVEKVENAVRKLGYQPDMNAKQLKAGNSRRIGFVLPYLDQSICAALLSETEKSARAEGYCILPMVTENNPSREAEAISELTRQNVDGLIVVSCSDSLEAYGIKGIPPLVFINRSPKELDADRVVINDRVALQAGLESLLEKGYLSFALISEYADLRFHDNYIDFLQDILKKHNIPDLNVRLVGAHKEDAFCAACEVLNSCPDLEVFISGGGTQTKGIQEALRLYGESCELLCFTEESWTQGIRHEIIRPVRQAAQSAVSLLLQNIEQQNRMEFTTVTLTSLWSERPGTDNCNCSEGFNPTPLKFLMLDCPAGAAAKLLSPAFTKETALEVEIELKNHADLRTAMSAGGYDGGMVDLTWLPELAAKNLLEPQGCIDESLYLDHFCRDYGSYGGISYGIPYMPGVMILFYRKDLFENPGIKRSFYRQTKRELIPPRTWADYNLTARFFTRHYNPDSPTEFGIAEGTRLDGQIVCNFCMRKWAYGGVVFDDAWRVRVNSPEILSALKNYVLSFSFATPWHAENVWEDQVRDFVSGKAAMTILFDSHAGKINQRSLSRITAEVGYDLVPGATPALGGWSLCVSSGSDRIEDALRFAQWICSGDRAYYYSVLSGSPVLKESFESPEIQNIYPWIQAAKKSYPLSRKRASSPGRTDTLIYESEYEAAIAAGIRAILAGSAKPEEALAHMQWELEKIHRGGI